MKVLVFGCNGQVARALARHRGVIAVGRDKADLADPANVVRAMERHTPDAVINAAAWTAVDAAEDQPAAAHRLNAEAPGAMAEACAQRRLPFLHISTDYVFDGSGTRPWREDDPTAPVSVYGRTKLAGEQAVADAGGRAAILRTAWVFSAHGQNFVKTMLRLSETRDRLRVVADQHGGPTPAADIAATLMTMAFAMVEDGAADGWPRARVYHYAGVPHVSWADFARAIVAGAGRTATVEDITTADYPTPATRPANARLECSRIAADFGIAPPDWRAGLRAVLQEIAP